MITIKYDNKDLEVVTEDVISLNLSKKGITNLGLIEGLDALENLQELSLIDNQISCIESLESLGNLQKLYLSNNKITRIDGLETLENLQFLDLSYNQINRIEGLDTLTNLRNLHLKYNQIKSIEGFEDLVNLQKLGLINNQIDRIDGLDTLMVLNELDLYYNRITTIEGLDNLVNLNWLGLSNNQITTIEGLDRLADLQALYLSHNQIASMNGVEALTNLQSLDLSNNLITEIRGLDTLVNLKCLILSDNKIPLIDGFNAVVNLEQLYLSRNQITEISRLEALVKLLSLDLSNNQIHYVQGIENLDSLLEIRIEGNPIVYEQEDLINSTGKEIREFCKNPPGPILPWPPSPEEVTPENLLDLIMNIGTYREKHRMTQREDKWFIEKECEIDLLHALPEVPEPLQVYLVQLHALDPVCPFARESTKLSRFINFISQFWDPQAFPALIYTLDNVVLEDRIARIVDTIVHDDGICKLIVFPENSIPFKMVSRLEYMATTYVETSPEHDKKVVIIGGLEHGIVPGKSVPTAYQEQNFPHPLRQDDSTTWPWLENQLYTNNSFIIDGGKLSFQEKQTPVKIDKGNGKYIIEPIEIRPEPQIKIFDTSVGKISIFICKDFLRLAGAIRHWARDNLVNYIVVPSLTSKVLPFTQRLINLYEQPNMDDITIITANVGEYGGSEVYSVKHKDAIERSFHDNKRDNLGEVVVKRRISKNQ